MTQLGMATCRRLWMLVAVAACASEHQDCWPVDDTTPRGSVELGTGDNGFEPMPDELALRYDLQEFFFISARARIHGMKPGDPVDVFNPDNPRTWFRVYFEDGTLITISKCPLRAGYQPEPADAYVIPAIQVVLSPRLGPADLFDKQLRVVLEVIDSRKSYATAEKLITVHAPVDWM